MKVEFNCEEWMQLSEQIERQTKICCENCELECKGRPLSAISVMRCFHQKPITLLLPESVFKCKAREACEENESRV